MTYAGESNDGGQQGAAPQVNATDPAQPPVATASAQVPAADASAQPQVVKASAQVPAAEAGTQVPPPQPSPPPSGGTVYGKQTATTYGTPAAAAPTKRKATLPALLTSAFLLIALLGSGAGVQLTRDLPDPTLTTSVASTLKVPGKAPKLPWPPTGSAELMVEGLGRIGGSGPKSAEPIGSVAKVMTAYVILKEHPLTGDQEGPTLTVSAADVADYEGRKATGQSLVHVEEGEELTERDALEALMLPSANNIAHQLGIWDAGSEEAFLVKMNAAAKSLGMADTEYTDPSGFLPSTVSTAADQVLLARAAIRMDVFAEIVEREDATIPVVGEISNYNDMLGVEGVFGIKTGSTDEAGGNLVFASRLKVGKRTLIVVGAVFNQPGANTPEQLVEVNKHVRRLLVAVRKTVKQYEILAAAPAGTVRTEWGGSTTVSPAAPLEVVGWPGLSLPVRVTPHDVGDEVTSGEFAGKVEASGVSVDLKTDAAIDEPSLWWRLTRTP